MKEALKLALEALEWCHGGEPCGTGEAITAIKAALAQECPNLKNCKGACFQCEYFNVDTGMMEYPAAQPAQEPWCMKMNRCTTKCEDCPDEPAQEPVGVFCEDDDIGYVRLIPHQQMKLKAWDKLYTAPQQRPWVGLTNEQISNEVIAGERAFALGFTEGAQWAEAKLKEKNT